MASLVNQDVNPEPHLMPTALNGRQRLLIGTAILSILLIGATIAAYFLDHSQTVKAFFDGQIEVSDALLKIAIPIVCIGFVGGLLLFIDRKHKKRVSIYEEQKKTQAFKNPSAFSGRMVTKPTIGSTIKSMCPNQEKRQLVKYTTLVLTFFALMMAVVFMADPNSNYWLHHTCIPALQKILHYKIGLGKALIGIGGGTLLFVTILNIAIQIFQKNNYLNRSRVQPICNFPQDLDSTSISYKLSSD